MEPDAVFLLDLLMPMGIQTDSFIWIPKMNISFDRGVTTEVTGQCGSSMAPVTPEGRKTIIQYLNFLGYPIPQNLEQYTSFGTWLEEMDKLPLGINLACLVGHGMVRMNVIGLDNRLPTPSEMERMKRLVDEAMQSGAFGLSSGLMYAPGAYANTAELGELCLRVGKYGGIYASHIRNQGEMLIQSVEETIAAAKTGNVPAIISHHKACGKSNWGKVNETIRIIHEASQNGEGVYHDVYPYLATSTTLNATLPPSCMAGGLDKLLENLTRPEFRKELEERIFSPHEKWDNDLLENGYENLLIVNAKATPAAVGKRISEYAAERGLSSFDAYVELLVKNKLDVTDVCFSLCEEDLEMVMQDGRCMIGSDGIYRPGEKMTHPRAVGTFPRVLGRYVREKKILSLTEAIRKMTSLTAQVYGLSNKGLIKAGYDADLVLFDADNIRDNATYLAPFEKNDGIDYVIVNGMIAVDHDQCTGAYSGRILRSNHYN